MRMRRRFLAWEGRAISMALISARWLAISHPACHSARRRMNLFSATWRRRVSLGPEQSVRFCDAPVRNRTAVWLSLGSNLGDRRRNLERALAALPGLGIERLRTSHLYRTAPVGMRGSWFLNCVAAGETALAPRPLLRRLQALEWKLGRRRLGPGYRARTIDLDLLLYGNRRIATRERRVLLLGLRELGAPLPAPATVAAAVRRQSVHAAGGKR